MRGLTIPFHVQCGTLKDPTHYSKRGGHEVPGVVAVLCESIAGPHQLIAAKTQPAQSNKETTTKGYDTDSDAEYSFADHDEEDSLEDSVFLRAVTTRSGRMVRVVQRE